MTERDPSDDLWLQFGATQQLNPEEKTTVTHVLGGLLLAHEARRWAASSAKAHAEGDPS